MQNNFARFFGRFAGRLRIAFLTDSYHPSTGMKSISLKIDESLDHWLQSEARRQGRTKSEIVRAILERERDGKPGASLHGLMQGVCGSLQGAPRDLSRNQRKYIKGF